MIILARAPFLAVLSGLAAMFALYDRAALWALPVIALFVTLGVMAGSFCDELAWQWRVAGVVLFCAAASSLWIVFSLSRVARVPPYVNTTGVVTENRPWGRLRAVAVKTPRGGFLMKVPFSSLTEGDSVLVEGNTEPFSSGSPFSDFREDRFWKARGMTALLTPASIQPAAGGSSAWNIHSWRSALYRALDRRLPRLTAAYLGAAWTGRRDQTLDKAHRAWGTSHILAVSGFHVGMVMAGASLIIKRGVWRVPMLSLLLWFYIFLTGAPASAVRAGLMIQAGLAGELAGRPGSALNAVSLAAVLLLLRSPFWFWDVGWRLSVLAALAIAVTLERWGSFGFRTWFFMNLMIWCAIFPQVSRTFGSTPLAGLFINLLAPQFFGVAFSAASAAAALFLLKVPLSSFLVLAVDGAFALWGVLADAAVKLIPWQLGWNPFSAYCCAALFIMFTCRALFVPWRNIALLSPLGALSAFALFVT